MQKYMDIDVSDFSSYLPADRFPELRSFGIHILAILGSTYLGIQLFSIMKYKTPFRSKLIDQQLSSILKISSDLKPNFVNDC